MLPSLSHTLSHSLISLFLPLYSPLLSSFPPSLPPCLTLSLLCAHLPPSSLFVSLSPSLHLLPLHIMEQLLENSQIGRTNSNTFIILKLCFHIHLHLAKVLLHKCLFLDPLVLFHAFPCCICRQTLRSWRRRRWLTRASLYGRLASTSRDVPTHSTSSPHSLSLSLVRLCCNSRSSGLEQRGV